MRLLLRHAVDEPPVDGRSGERRAQKAVALGLREQLGELVPAGLRLEAHVELDLRLDHRVPAVAGALRDQRLRRPSCGRDLEALPLRVVAEALQRAAHEAGEEEMLGRPFRLWHERRPVLGADVARLAEIDRVAQLLRPDGHGRILANSGPPPSAPPRTLPVMRRLRPLSEAECYARSYLGWEPTVTVVRLP